MARVLVIDGNILTRHMLRQALERAGYEVLEAPDGRLGAQTNRVTPSDIVITDILMPQQAGLETIRELRRDFPGMKIIATSGEGQIGDYNVLTIAERLGARRAFQKPFVLRDILNAVREVLQTGD